MSLTTHVLDTARGRPAAGVRVELHRIEGDERRVPVAEARTNADGRLDRPLLSADAAPGVYELTFHVGDYFAPPADQLDLGLAAPTMPFLDRVPIRVGLADPAAHYHVPLLVSPFAYSTYRGS